MILDNIQNLVRKFHRKVEHPVGDVAYPEALTLNRRMIRADWCDEEIREFRAAETLAEQADASIDLIYFAVGNLVEMGVHGDIIFSIVHEANMRKEGGDKRGDTKQLKPDGWVGPEEEIQKYLDAITTEV